MRRFNVQLLPLLTPAAKQDYKLLAILPKIHSVPRPEVQPNLIDSRSNTFGLREIAHSYSENRT